MAAFTVIDHQELGVSTWAPSGTGTAAYWEKTGISSSYDHLYLVASVRGERTAYYDSLSLTVNSITSSVYSNTAIFANSSSVVATRESSRAQLVNCFWPGANALDDTFGSMTIWIPNYANELNYKSFVMRSVSPNNSTGSGDWIVGFTAGLYAQTTPISSIKIASGAGTDLAEYSTFTLYGITGA
jgi:hypothetical protein